MVSVTGGMRYRVMDDAYDGPKRIDVWRKEGVICCWRVALFLLVENAWKLNAPYVRIALPC